MFGEAMSYWDFFPARRAGGACRCGASRRCIASEVPELEAGARVFGYLPPSSELLVAPAHVGAHGFTDSSAHRAALPPAYNRYARTDADPLYEAEHEDQQMLLRPLFLTSYLIDDFLEDADFFGAETIVLSSASSKTASALAFQLSLREGVLVVGLTSSGAPSSRARSACTTTCSPTTSSSRCPEGRAVYVDMAGDARAARGRPRSLRRASSRTRRSSAPRTTSAWAQVPDALPGPRPTFFFAPDRASKRAADWGADGLQQRMADAWHPYVAWACGWLQVTTATGATRCRAPT